MHIRITIKDKSIALSLMNNNELLAKSLQVEERSLAECLLRNIDDLLEINKYSVGDIEKIAVVSDLGENFTTQRIAMCTANVFNWGKAVDN